MMYKHHGLQVAFTGNYAEYFGMATDVDAMVYLATANYMLHHLYKGKVTTIAEDRAFRRECRCTDKASKKRQK